MIRIGLWHFGQEGGGEFLGMGLALNQARALPNSLSPTTAEVEPMMNKAYSAQIQLSARYPTLEQITLGELRSYLPGSGFSNS
jgi:hypothetical protein